MEFWKPHGKCNWIYKNSQMAQALKSNLMPNINDALMHHPEIPSMWS